MSETPLSDELRSFRAEGLNDKAVSDLATMALDRLEASMPDIFDDDGMPYSRHSLTIATSFQAEYLKGQVPE